MVRTVEQPHGKFFTWYRPGLACLEKKDLKKSEETGRPGCSIFAGAASDFHPLPFLSHSMHL